MNGARLTVEQTGQPTRELKNVRLTEDAYARLATPGAIHAQVNLLVQRMVGYGELKVCASVNLTCDQNEPMLNEAGLRAFEKAVEFVNDGFTLLTMETTGKAP